MFVSVREVILTLIEENIKKIADELGVEFLEISAGRDYKAFLPTGKKVNILKNKEEFITSWKESGLTIHCILEFNDFSDDNEKELDYILKGIELAESIGAKVVRIDPLPTKEKEIEKEKVIERGVEILDRALSITRDSYVKLGIENHGIIGNDPDFLIKVVEQINSPRLGYTLDTGNFYWSGKPLSQVYEIMERLSPRVYHTHVKNIKYPRELREKKREIGYEYEKYVSPIFEGDIDHRKVAEILKKAGYTGDFCIEDESLGKYNLPLKKEILKKDLEYLKSVLRDMERKSV